MKNAAQAWPEEIYRTLKDAGVRDLGIHSEMLVDGMIDLVEAGLVTGACKKIDRYQVVFTFAAGSRRQYDFINRNPNAQGRPVVRKTGAQGSGILSSMSQANCFIILPYASGDVEPDTLVEVQPFFGLV